MSNAMSTNETTNAESRFRATAWSPRVPDAQPVPHTSPAKIVLKLAFGGSIRLVEVSEPATIGAVRSAFEELFGAKKERIQLTYSLPGDCDDITVKTDADLALAQRFGGQPLKIEAVDPAEEDEDDDDEQDRDFEEEQQQALQDGDEAQQVAGNVFECAAKSLADNGLAGVDPGGIKALLAALELRPRRLVKYGLAPRKSLDVGDASNNQEASNDKTEASDNKQADEDEEDKTKDGAWEAVDKVEQMSLQDDDDKEEPSVVVDDAVVVEEEQDSGSAERDDAVVAALRAKGVTLDATAIHALLRLLDVPPRRFVKLGLVASLDAARKAYKHGGKAAAEVLFKGGRARGWGRGLGGGRGRGRGRGWAFDQHLGKKPKLHHHGPRGWHHRPWHGPPGCEAWGAHGGPHGHGHGPHGGSHGPHGRHGHGHGPHGHGHGPHGPHGHGPHGPHGGPHGHHGPHHGPHGPHGGFGGPKWGPPGACRGPGGHFPHGPPPHFRHWCPPPHDG